MSRPSPLRRASDPIIIDIPSSRPANRTRQSPQSPSIPRRPSLPSNPTVRNVAGAPKLSRTSKTSQRHVVLPSEPQTKPLIDDEVPEDGIIRVHAGRTEAERMSKDERQRDGYSRLTAYSVAEGIRMKHLAPFLKREHAVTPRVFDEAIYVVYHLPLLSGYAQNVNIRSSAPVSQAILSRMSEAEEYGYEGSYFPDADEPGNFSQDGYISSSPVAGPASHRPPRRRDKMEEQIGEAVFFSYGVAVFFGFNEGEERDILDDIESAEAWVRKWPEDDWEIEECHFTIDPTVEFPRIYNDFFTFKARSHLVSLSVAHALAQSTLLAHYETIASSVLLHQVTTRIPKELATTGSLSLTRGDALKLTGRLFKLRTDVNLVSNVLDVPELFWSEASLKGLYDAVREYLEIGPRVNVLNERLSVANDLLDLIHDHVNSGKMDRITWIIIWLIVVACVVELGEVLARIVVHAGTASSHSPATVSPHEALQAVYRVMDGL
ncbi:hypothetical protein M422DRAFT_76855 [Sphaerobolus stellatus SS14]|uniref:DUF155 domain-containing protein n=1 Tax=Sphaerobolus stellatus (strain SS14) TaxID=990650 RepID=A0A0C9US36_SPHS4|nr:hypothetical protein M422DRAFT_76855 [Sphaerobolus stellatus SS14]